MSKSKTKIAEIRAIERARRSPNWVDRAVAEGVISHERINPEWLQEESAIINTALPPYRFMTPYERTDAFMREYIGLYPAKQQQLTGRKGRPITKISLPMWSDREAAGFWRARQCADLLGMPYREYIRAAMDDAIAHNHKQLPSPNQLYTDRVFDSVRKVKTDLRASGRWGPLGRVPDARYLVENYRAEPVQIAMRDLIQQEVIATPKASRHRELRHYMRELRVIDEADARLRLGDELVDSALGEKLLNPVRASEPTEGPYHPGCFAMVVLYRRRSACSAPMLQHASRQKARSAKG